MVQRISPYRSPSVSFADSSAVKRHFRYAPCLKEGAKRFAQTLASLREGGGTA